MSEGEQAFSKGKGGRPRKVDGPKVPYHEIDRILVFGELGDLSAGEQPTYPSLRELAKRYGVTHSVIADYARKHNCMRRREQAQARIEARSDQQLIELRATAVAMSKDDTLRIIDTFIGNFERALSEGRVRFENPTDFNTMVRLKEFLQGGADSRQEVHAALSLEHLQARHKQMLQGAEGASAAERGDVDHHPAVSGEARHGAGLPHDIHGEAVHGKEAAQHGAVTQVEHQEGEGALDEIACRQPDVCPQSGFMGGA